MKLLPVLLLTLALMALASTPREAAIVIPASPSGDTEPDRLLSLGAPNWSAEAATSKPGKGHTEPTATGRLPIRYLRDSPSDTAGVPFTTADALGSVRRQAESAVRIPAALPTPRKEATPQTRAKAPTVRVPAPVGADLGVLSPWAKSGLHPILESWYRGTAAGLASWMPESYGALYLALPIGAGFRVRICGAAACVVMTSNDAGPDLSMQRRGRVADLAVAVWEWITGLPRGLGLAQITVTLIGRVH